MQRKDLAKAVIQKGDEYLLIKREPGTKFFPGQWDFPGGKLESDEDAQAAVVRETKEETGLDIVAGDKIFELKTEEQDTILHFAVFSAKEFEEEVVLSDDHTEYKWVSKNKLEDYDVSPVVRKYFNL